VLIIKLTTPWPHNYYAQSPNNLGITGEYKFEINNDCNRCDYWIIWGGLLKEESVNVDPRKVIYITDEAHDQRIINLDFLAQFPFIAAVRKDLAIQNVIPIHEIAPWYFKKGYNEIHSLPPPQKTKKISVVCSDLTWLPGHKKRFAFVNKLIGHFKDKLDVYGRGFNEIEDKFDALSDYKYSVAIENNRIPDYFTEKISECFLTYTIPIYFGCPNIGKYYDPRALINIDIDDYQAAIKVIEALIEEDPYPDYLPYLKDSRERFLNKYHVFPAIINLIKKISPESVYFTSEKSVKIIPEMMFSEVSNKVDLNVRDAVVLLKRVVLNKFR
jgi:hypothetical protein